MTVPEKAYYINNLYNNHVEWIINYPHYVKKKCNNLTQVQLELYNWYSNLKPPTRENAIYFITQLTHEQIEMTGV